MYGLIIIRPFNYTARLGNRPAHHPERSFDDSFLALIGKDGEDQYDAPQSGNPLGHEFVLAFFRRLIGCGKVEAVNRRSSEFLQFKGLLDRLQLYTLSRRFNLLPKRVRVRRLHSRVRAPTGGDHHLKRRTG